MSGGPAAHAVRAELAWQIKANATYRERVRLAAFLTANPEAVVDLGEFGEWYCDLPDGRAHARTLGLLLGKLEAVDSPDDG